MRCSSKYCRRPTDTPVTVRADGSPRKCPVCPACHARAVKLLGRNMRAVFPKRRAVNSQPQEG